jgi:sec-independent protein translocase protein TatA
MPIGPTELLILLLIILLLFGARRIPEIGRSVGTGMREFKDSVTGKGDREDEGRPELAGSRETSAEEPRDEAGRPPGGEAAPAERAAPAARDVRR